MRGIRGRGPSIDVASKLDDIDQFVEFDAHRIVLEPARGAVDRFAAFEFDRHAGAGRDGAISADQHPAGGDVLDQAQLAAFADHQRTDPEQRQGPIALAPVGRHGRSVAERVKRRFDGHFFHGPTLCCCTLATASVPTNVEPRPFVTRRSARSITTSLKVQPYWKLALISAADRRNDVRGGINRCD